MLRTVEAGQSSGAYPVDFVDQLQAYVQELRRYFNLEQGAMDRLYTLRGELDDDLVMIIDELHDAMGAMAMAAAAAGGGRGEGLTGAEGILILRALRAATAVRGHFTAQLGAAGGGGRGGAMGMRDETTGLVDKAAVERRQAYRQGRSSVRATHRTTFFVI